MAKLRKEIDDFVGRIKRALELEEDPVLDRICQTQKWVAETLEELEKETQDASKKEGSKRIISKLFSKHKDITPN